MEDKRNSSIKKACKETNEMVRYVLEMVYSQDEYEEENEEDQQDK